DVAIARVEQLYPFPDKELATVVRRYANVEDVRWVQEEPKNQGAWFFVSPLIAEVLGPEGHLRYVGRDEAASPATGNYKIHQSEEQALLDDAFKQLRRLRPPSAAKSEERAAG
ncbi:MAG: 2-oxoglutarate dehydrogenase E1 component, partial [Candidatus Binatia bacterium]